MKPRLAEFAVIGILGMVIPGVIFHYLAQSGQGSEIPSGETMAVSATVQMAQPERTILLLLEDGSVEELTLDDYITGVVLAEMPADFEKQALMAQAVAARTYTLRRCGTIAKHETATVCTKASCCQAYISQEDYYSRGGVQEDFKKINQAVRETSGEVLCYDGELIESTYFSCSGGMTEDAQAVWGSDIPYLVAQPSPGEESADGFIQSVTISREEFLKKLGLSDPGLTEPLLGSITYTQGGGVDTMEICGNIFSGVELRSTLGLRSTSFLITPVGENVTITTRGYGHRVGLSQYGADAMAASGNGYKEILAYYYPGTELTTAATD